MSIIELIPSAQSIQQSHEAPIAGEYGLKDAGLAPSGSLNIQSLFSIAPASRPYAPKSHYASGVTQNGLFLPTHRSPALGKSVIAWAEADANDEQSLGRPSHRTRPGHGALVMTSSSPLDTAFTADYMGGSTEVGGHPLQEIAELAEQEDE